jgi:hypothetical protein
MKLRKENILTNILLGTGLYLLDSMRDRLSGSVDDLRGRARDTYDVASDRVSRAADVITGEDRSGLNTAFAVLIGVGIGVGVGMLLAPASGEETRQKIQDSISGRREPATGTYGM